jgi:hypothetical protein
MLSAVDYDELRTGDAVVERLRVVDGYRLMVRRWCVLTRSIWQRFVRSSRDTPRRCILESLQQHPPQGDPIGRVGPLVVGHVQTRTVIVDDQQFAQVFVQKAEIGRGARRGHEPPPVLGGKTGV